MKVVLLRVGIDTGCGGCHGALLQGDRFVYIPIPDFDLVAKETYASLRTDDGLPLDTFLPEGLRKKLQNHPVHHDPEFMSFTYGDPTIPKRGLRHLEPGDILIFYSGLEGRQVERAPALYIIGYFEVAFAGLATELSAAQIEAVRENFHVKHPRIFKAQKDRLVLVKGGRGSRMLQRAHQISEMATDRAGKPLMVISKRHRAVFGDFGGRVSLKRSPPRRVDPAFVSRAASFVRSLS